MVDYNGFEPDEERKGAESIPQSPAWGPSFSGSLVSDPRTWGPTHTTSDDTEDATAAGCTDARNEETWTTFLANMFNCGDNIAPEELEELDLEIEEDPFFGSAASGGACASTPFFSGKSKSKRRDTNLDSSEGETTTRREDSLDLVPGQRAWSSPARLRHGNSGALLDECGFTYLSNDKPNNTFYFSDMDTFLSDDFTVMEQGLFNHLYDHICKPVNNRRKRGVAQEKPKAVLLSFDDTLSKLTQEDGQRSLSTMSLNTLEHMKKSGVVDEATIAAIVNAQAKTGWKSRVKEEVESKADDLSQYGVEHTLAELDIPPVAPTSTNPGSVIYVHHNHAEPKDDEDDTTRQEGDRPTSPTEDVHISSNIANGKQEEEDKDKVVNNTKSTKPFAKKFLKNPFRRHKKKNKNSTEGKPPKPNQGSDVKTPPRAPREHALQSPSPTTSATGPCSSVSADSHKLSIEANDQVDAPVEAPTRPNGPPKTPYIQITSTENEDFVENVELYREPCRPNTKKAPFIVNDDIFDALEEKKEDFGDFPSWVHSERKLEAPDIEDDTLCSSMGQQSLATMTSRLKEEQQETERLRKMLEEKDEDLERLKELLRSNESNAVFERFHSAVAQEF